MSGTPTGPSTRSYEKSHPWISFGLDLKKADYRLWIDLGAVQSKIEHVANVLLPPEIAANLRTVYLAKGVHGTTAIEGNSLTEDQVHERISRKTRLPESKEYLGKDIDNIVNACNAIWNQIRSGKSSEVTVERIKAFNRMVLKGLPLSEGIKPGEIRTYSVGVANYKAPPAEDAAYLLNQLCDLLNNRFQCPHEELATGFAVLRAIMAHLYIAWIHPFGDGNGRTARLLEFQILLSGSVPTIAAHLPSNFYNQTRDKYYLKLSATSRSAEGVFEFLHYAIQGLRDQLQEQIEYIRKFQWEVVWRDYVYQSFRGQSGTALHRRRLIALELPRFCEVEIGQLRRMTPEIAELYAGRTSKTITRDLNALTNMNLILRRGKKVRPNAAILTQFLPDQVGNPDRMGNPESTSRESLPEAGISD
jgi:Fic family protein